MNDSVIIMIRISSTQKWWIKLIFNKIFDLRFILLVIFYIITQFYWFNFNQSEWAQKKWREYEHVWKINFFIKYANGNDFEILLCGIGWEIPCEMYFIVSLELYWVFWIEIFGSKSYIWNRTFLTEAIHDWELI